MDIMTAKEAAEKWGLTERRVTEIIRSGRIKGVFKIGAAWVMPADTQKPPDGRRFNTVRPSKTRKRKKKEINNE